MTRPEDIPERVWALAGRFCGQYEFNTLDERALVARAILAAEKRVREECAQIADCAATFAGAPETDAGYVATEIAAAIRKGGKDA